ncbi:hypothetical protein D0Z07_8731 [Hyphodiscus hymeniophilus]|uniref:LYR motif-containing protein 2 n=1 Tax=Hyphodiscus hymeniophilus TaxID=353542 RepID=A0A9P6SK40_9HELO|nr:hypothetical protein D0Z07_8731 [Hyphodiscus hymeniophilus]
MQLLRPCVFLRTYVSSAKSPRSKLGNTIGLDHFLQRNKAIALWRNVVRGCRRIADPQTRGETLRFAREEFKRHKHVTDITHIRYLISTGKTQWDTMERYIDGL